MPNQEIDSILERLKDLERQLGKQPTRFPVGGGAGASSIFHHVATFASLPSPVPTTDGFWIVDDEPNLYFPMGALWHCLTGWKIPE